MTKRHSHKKKLTMIRKPITQKRSRSHVKGSSSRGVASLSNKLKTHIKIIRESNNIDLIKESVSKMLEGPLSLRLFRKENKEILQNTPTELRNYTNYSTILKNEFSELNKTPKYQPQNDYYDFINYQWLDEATKKLVKNPKYYVEVDDFRIVQDKVYREVLGYLKTYIEENPKSKKAQAVNAIYKCITHAKVSTGLKHAQDLKKQVEGYIEDHDMYGLLAYASGGEIYGWQSPIVWTVMPDEKNVKKYISHLSPPQLGIYDYFIYIDDPKDTPKTKQFKTVFREKYLEFIGNVFKEVLPHEYKDYNPQDVWDVEVEMLNVMGCDEIKKEDPNYYNVVTKKELEEKYGFNWTLFTEKLGYKTPPKKVICSSLNAFKCTTQLLKKNWTTAKWKTYWLFIWFKQMIRFQWDWSQIYFDFYGKFVKGQPVRMPKDLYSIFPLSFTFNTLLSELYINHNSDALKERYVTNMVEDLKYIFMNKIKKNNWLSPTTKRSALKKLEKLEVLVGHPKKLREDPLLNYRDDDPWHNMNLLSTWKKNKYIELEGKGIIDIPEIDWNEFKLVGTQSYMVNAYYRPTSNSIYVPLAYLQRPFLDLDQRGIEYNLAYLGYTLGHELSHSLDDMGSKFDADGNLNNWWTDNDKKIFKQKIKDVVDQYQEFAARDGIKFDAEVGVGEDLADISGLALAEEYLFYFQMIHHDIPLVKNLSFEAFYTYSAIQSRQKIFDEAVPAQLKQNPHPLEKYRCNCPLARLPIFREIYNVKKGDGMWWHNTDTIW